MLESKELERSKLKPLVAGVQVMFALPGFKPLGNSSLPLRQAVFKESTQAKAFLDQALQTKSQHSTTARLTRNVDVS